MPKIKTKNKQTFNMTALEIKRTLGYNNDNKQAYVTFIVNLTSKFPSQKKTSLPTIKFLKKGR